MAFNCIKLDLNFTFETRKYIQLGVGYRYNLGSIESCKVEHHSLEFYKDSASPSLTLTLSSLIFIGGRLGDVKINPLCSRELHIRIKNTF